MGKQLLPEGPLSVSTLPSEQQYRSRQVHSGVGGGGDGGAGEGALNRLSELIKKCTLRIALPTPALIAPQEVNPDISPVSPRISFIQDSGASEKPT